MSRLPRALSCALLTLLTLLMNLAPAARADAPLPLEPLAGYQPAARCSPAAKPGAVELARWLVRRYGSHDSISRGCRPGSRVTSEHQEGRAIDWFADARTPRGRAVVRRLLGDLFAPDGSGNADARARRMGVMYVIWDDHMYPAWNGFRPEPYLSSSCRTRRSCSPTLRHRDHVHVSLTRQGARGLTSWYVARRWLGRARRTGPTYLVRRTHTSTSAQPAQSAFQPSTSSALREAGPV